MNLLIEKTAANKNTQRFFWELFIIYVRLSWHLVFFIKISYQMYITWSCVTSYHSFNRANGNCISASWKWFDIEVYTRSTWFRFEFNLFWIFMKKPLWKEKDSQQLFWRTVKTRNTKIFRIRNIPDFKAIWTVLGRSKPKILFVGQPWWPKFFQDLAPSNYFSASAALHLQITLQKHRSIIIKEPLL